MAKKILLVEDELDLSNLYKEILTGEGYEVDTALDGQTGLEKISQGGYDLILLDIVLPIIDGLTILKKIQVNPPKQSNGSIVLLTNLGAEAVVADGVSLGARSYLLKSSLRPDQLVQEVNKILDQQNPSTWNLLSVPIH